MSKKSSVSIGSNLNRLGKWVGLFSFFIGLISIALIGVGIYFIIKYKNLYKRTVFKVTKVDFCNKHTHHKKHSSYTDYYCSLTLEYIDKTISKNECKINTEGPKYNVGDTLEAYYNVKNKNDVKQQNPYHLGIALSCVGGFLLIFSILRFICSRYKSCSQLLAISWLANLFRPRHYFY
tara:strand:- start:188 stop:721 length:534 start_codon:yes stop_codon:yes gene_type:complete